MERMVVGFLFDIDGYKRDEKVLLIRKNRPDWQKGKLNGVGGHIEEGETALEAMTREFKEEADKYGLTGVEEWREFAELEGPGWHVTLFMSYGQADQARSETDEYVELHHVECLMKLEVIPNLRWLVPMALDTDKMKIKVTYL